MSTTLDLGPLPASRAPLAQGNLLRNHSLTLVLMGMFLMSWMGQFATGRAKYNNDRHDHHLTAVSATEYFTSGHFWQATAENWESEFLQMGMYVVLTIFLFQKGSPESRDPDKLEEDCDDNPDEHRTDPNAPWPVRKGGIIAFLYSHSLSLTLFTLFALSMLVHLVKGAQLHREEALWAGHPPTTVWDYASSADFWFESLQNWQSEFLSIAVMVFLGVYLRQRWSPESKPVHAAHDASE